MVKRVELGFQFLIIGLILTVSAYGFSFILTTSTNFCIVDGIRDSLNVTKLESCITKTSDFNILTYYIGFAGIVLLAVSSVLFSNLSFNKSEQKKTKPFFIQILTFVGIVAVSLSIIFLVVYGVLSYYEIDPGFLNIGILLIEVGVGITIALIVERRTGENKKLVESALGSIHHMVMDDFLLRKERKNTLARNLKKNLISLRFFTQKNFELGSLWRIEKDPEKKQKRALAVMYGLEDVQYSLNRLNEIKNVSIDVFEYGMIELIDYILHSVEKQPVVDKKNNKCFFIYDTNGFFMLIKDLLSRANTILESDPDSFESNYKLVKKMKEESDGTYVPILVVEEKIPGKKKSHDPKLVMEELMAPTIFYKLNEKYEDLKSLNF